MKQNRGQPDQNRTAALPDPDDFDETLSELEGANEDVRRLRPLTVLELLTESTQPLTLAQLAVLMRVPKSTLMRLLQSMEKHGYVLHMPAERGFVTGPRANTLALKTLRGTNMRRACRAVLRNLVNRLGETCNLTVPDAGRVLYVERVETSEPLRMHLPLGTWVPMHCTASGKLFLASMSLLERQSILSRQVLARHSPHTIIDRQELEAELAKNMKRGVGVDNEEFVRGMIAVSVPVHGPEGKVVAAIACHAPTARLSLDNLFENVPQLRSAATEMGAILFPDA
ncbi:MAG: IclR family transcriptional regulator [Azoarcus sp.]|jgi:DNA-binding IclR family transcriptional regulator|nr:IclR family transcriptional regulator [Azoarcus sp.]MDD2874448.1 IclR family transcriptional regulator [Azoarcus sp.]